MAQKLTTRINGYALTLSAESPRRIRSWVRTATGVVEDYHTFPVTEAPERSASTEVLYYALLDATDAIRAADKEMSSGLESLESGTVCVKCGSWLDPWGDHRREGCFRSEENTTAEHSCDACSGWLPE